jgi:hypothetical protein
MRRRQTGAFPGSLDAGRASAHKAVMNSIPRKPAVNDRCGMIISD